MKRETVTKPSGYVVVTCPGGDVIEHDTLQCVHCGAHWIASPGSGKIRGFCMKCNGPICGPGCVECVPHEQKLENIEKGNPALFVPIISGYSSGG